MASNDGQRKDLNQHKSPSTITPKNFFNVSFESRHGFTLKQEEPHQQQIDHLLGFDDD
jgi:hypothetical protein